MKAVIFGAGGQDGHYLSRLCASHDVEVLAYSRSEGPWLRGDVGDLPTVEALVSRHRPDYIFHLAANSTTRHEALFENHRTICDGTLNILESCLRHHPQARIFLTGSGLQFENRGVAISERDEFSATSPYALARIQSVYAGRYFRSRGLKVYVGYLFHHESPLRKASHVARQISAAVARIAAGSPETIELGDIAVEKEWTFAGDVAQAIWTLTNQSSVFEAIIGSGRLYSIRDWLHCCFSVVGMDWADHVHQRTGFVAEYPRLWCDASTIRSLGWQPKVAIEQLASMMVQSDIDAKGENAPAP